MAIARPRRAVKPQLCAATAPKGAGLGPRMRGPSDHPYMASSDDFPKGRVSDSSIERPGFRRRRDMGPLMVASCCRLDEPNLNRQCKNIGCGGCHLCEFPIGRKILGGPRMFPHTLCHRISPSSTILFAAADGRCWLTCTDDARTIALPASRVAASHSSFVASAIEGAIAAGWSFSCRLTARQGMLPAPCRLIRSLANG